MEFSNNRNNISRWIFDKHIIKQKELKFDNMILKKNKLMKSETTSRCTEVFLIAKMQRLKS